MIMQRRALIVALIAAALPLAPGEAQMSKTEIDVARLELGALPGDFVGALTGQGQPGQWSVVTDASAGSGRAIAQTGADRTDPGASTRPPASRSG